MAETDTPQELPEPTEDSGADTPEEFGDDDENQDQDAGVGDAEIEYDLDPFAEGDG